MTPACCHVLYHEIYRRAWPFEFRMTWRVDQWVLLSSKFRGSNYSDGSIVVVVRTLNHVLGALGDVITSVIAKLG